MNGLIGLAQQIRNSEQYSEAVPKAQDVASLFTQTIDDFMNRRDKNTASNFRAAIKGAVSMDEEALSFTNTDGGNAFENYSRVFTLKDAQNKERQYVLRNGKEAVQIELVRLDRFPTTRLEDADAIAAYPNITLNDLRTAIDRCF